VTRFSSSWEEGRRRREGSPVPRSFRPREGPVERR